MCGIKVKRSIHAESPNDAEERTVFPVSYTDSAGGGLLQGFSSNGPSGKSMVFRRSEDNGATWHPVGQWEVERPLDGNLVWNRCPGPFFLDSRHNVVVRLVMEQQRDKGSAVFAKENPWHRFRRLTYEISRDGGRSWEAPIRLIVDGCDETHWAPHVEYGVNSLMTTGSPPFLLDDGRICLPCCLLRADRDQDLGPEGPGMTETYCLRGTWADDRRSITWQAGDYIGLKRAQSNEGASEGTMAQLPDGRVLAVLRASTAAGNHPTGPCYKWYAASDDRGRTWSSPAILTYDDDQPVYSPTAYSNLVHSIKNGRFYLIANLMNYPYEFWASGSCWPRDILQIAELDVETLRLKRDTVTVIEQRQPGQPRYIGFSNFCWYQDRETQDLVLFVTPMVAGWPGLHDHENACRRAGTGVPGHCYRYDICLPED